MDKKRKKTKPRADRNRKLNVVYFIDSAKTRSFTILMTRINFLIAGLALLVTWSAVSTGLLYYLVSENVDHRTKYKEALSTIFEYQSRYDGVYEQAYPSGGSRSPVLASNEAAAKKIVGKDLKSPAAAKLNSAKKQADKKADLLAQKKAVAKKIAEAKKKSDAAAKLNAEESKNLASSDQKDSGWKLEVIKAKVVKRLKGFDLKFAIRNHAKRKKAVGYVWAIASFQKDSGEVIYLSAPSHIRVDKYGKALNASRSHKYSIRNFKEKRFNFLAPAGLSGTLTAVDIGLLSSDGGESRIKKIPVKVRYTAPSAKKPAKNVAKSTLNSGTPSEGGGVNPAKESNSGSTPATSNGQKSGDATPKTGTDGRANGTGKDGSDNGAAKMKDSKQQIISDDRSNRIKITPVMSIGMKARTSGRDESKGISK